MFQSYAFLRILTILCLVVFYNSVTKETYSRAYLSILLGHFLLGIWYARNQIQKLATHKEFHPAASFVVILSAFTTAFHYFFAGISAPISRLYFSVHVSLTDTYVIEEKSKNNLQTKHLSLSRGLLNFSAFFLVLHNIFVLQVLPLTFYVSMVIASSAYYIYVLLRCYQQIPRRALLDMIAFDAIGVVAAFAFIPLKLSFMHGIFYHIVFWFFVPLTCHLKNRPKEQMSYVVQTICISTLFYFLYSYSGSAMHSASIYGAYLHTNVSFALSKMNPVWIRNFFYKSA